MDHTKITRNILSDKPRVTRFTINWEPKQDMSMGEMQQA